MRKVLVEAKNKVSFENIHGLFRKKVTNFGTGAKIDCPKEYLDKDVCVIILNKSES